MDGIPVDGRSGVRHDARHDSGNVGKDDADAGLYLGLDVSTQSIKAVVLDAQGKVYGASSTYSTVSFDSELSMYGTQGGVHRDGTRVTSPSVMFVHGIELLFDKMRANGFPFDRVRAVSASGQQHGSVFWTRRGIEAMRQFCGHSHSGENGASVNSASTCLYQELQRARAFAVEASPVWMDASTSAHCDAIEKLAGGADFVAQLTGSRAYERYTAPQIMKIAIERPLDYRNTDRIMLISTLIASILIGDYASDDVADGSGMLLAEIQSEPMEWSDTMLRCVAPDLRTKLCERPVHSYDIQGRVNRYFVEKYGFPAGALVSASSGDNPNSVAGLRLAAGDLVMSLGTSDTVFGLSHEATPTLVGHVYRSPLAPKQFLPLICYSNGSLTRESVKGTACSWSEFEALVENDASSPPGNNGILGVFFLVSEIVPRVTHSYDDALFFDYAEASTSPEPLDPASDRVRSITHAQRCRAVLEYRAIAAAQHMAHLGVTPKRILLTGGGARSQVFAQILADVLQVEIFTQPEHNSAALGAALRARHALLCHQAGTYIAFGETVNHLAPTETCVAKPRREYADVYNVMKQAYERIEGSGVLGRPG
ncbi:Xylulose kinase [Porphyridium purpureum]|uniref:Xylulose kinase n=1 Tax=Porphyridium purpureum TaxID=35688 RepID=A0A5J4Z0P2_PORPP|nr:Xylulose kinase [Porphyridium purpureum]|eukprot:POR9641..scf208_2